METLARRHKRFDAPVVDRLSVLVEGRPDEVLLKALEAIEPSSWKKVVEESGVSAEEAEKALQGLLERGDLKVLGDGEVTGGTVLYSGRGWGRSHRAIQGGGRVVPQAVPAEVRAAEGGVEESAGAWRAGVWEGCG